MLAIHEASSGPPSGSWPWLGGVRVLAGGRAAGGELGLQAVEDGLEAELEGVVGCRAVAGGGGCLEAGVQPGELRGDLAGFGHAVAYQLFGVTAIAAELPGERDRRGCAEGVAEHEGEDAGRCLVGLPAGKPSASMDAGGWA